MKRVEWNFRVIANHEIFIWNKCNVKRYKCLETCWSGCYSMEIPIKFITISLWPSQKHSLSIHKLIKPSKWIQLYDRTRWLYLHTLSKQIDITVKWISKLSVLEHDIIVLTSYFLWALNEVLKKNLIQHLNWFGFNIGGWFFLKLIVFAGNIQIPCQFSTY